MQSKFCEQVRKIAESFGQPRFFRLKTFKDSCWIPSVLLEVLEPKRFKILLICSQRLKNWKFFVILTQIVTRIIEIQSRRNEEKMIQEIVCRASRKVKLIRIEGCINRWKEGRSFQSTIAQQNILANLLCDNWYCQANPGSFCNSVIDFPTPGSSRR